MVYPYFLLWWRNEIHKFHTHNMTLKYNINKSSIVSYGICNDKSFSSHLFVILAHRDLSQVRIPRVTLLQATTFVFFQHLLTTFLHIPRAPEMFQALY
jgi:hypothetical protein